MSRPPIQPGVAPRLVFCVLDADSEPVTDFEAADISAASYNLFVGDVRTVGSAITVGSDVADTASHSTGQIVTIRVADGLYAIDAPTGAANSSYDSVEAAITASDGTLQIFPARHVIDVTVSTRSDFNAAEDDVSVGSIAENAIDADAIAADAGAEIAAAVKSELGTGDTLTDCHTADISGLFDDADVSTLITNITNAVVAHLDESTDLPVTVIRDAVVNALLAQADSFKATGFSTHDAADVVTALGTGSSLTACLTATGFSTHSAADVWLVATRTLTSLPNVTIGSYASGQSPADLVSVPSASAVASTVDTVLTTAHGSGSWQTGSGSGGSGTATLEKQNAILAAIEGGTVNVVARTKNGTELLSYIGDDDVRSNAQRVSVSDVDGALRTKLQAATSVIFGAGNNRQSNEITGTIDKAEITNSDDVTTIPVEISSDNKPATPDVFDYHIKAIDGDGNEYVEITGRIELKNERATP